MVMTYRLSVLVVSSLAAVLGGCTYNEDDLRGVHQDTLQDSSIADLVTVNSPIDTEGVDAGLVVDVAGSEFAPRVDTSEIDARVDASSSRRIDASSDTGIDAPSDTEIDISSSSGINDSGSVDHQSVDVFSADAGDRSIDSLDSNIDVSAMDVQVSEAGGMDGLGEALTPTVAHSFSELGGRF
jgi:hypothetical protein